MINRRVIIGTICIATTVVAAPLRPDSPIAPRAYEPVLLRELTPEGWLLTLLKTQVANFETFLYIPHVVCAGS